MVAQTSKSRGATQQESGLLGTLNAKLAKQLERERALDPPPQPAKQTETPNVLSIIEDAIALIPGTTVEFSVIERYPSDDFKDRVFRAREALCIV